MRSRLRGIGACTQDIALFAPDLEPGFVITQSIAQLASDAVDFRDIGAALGCAAQRTKHARGPAVVPREIDKVVGLRRCDSVHLMSPLLPFTLLH